MRRARHLLAGLRMRLLLLVLLTLVPALGLMLATYLEQSQQEIAQVQESGLRLVRLASTDHERLIDRTRQLLVALAQLPQVRGGDSAVCSDLLAHLLTLYPLYANFGVIAPDGTPTCSALPMGPPLSLSDRAYFRRAIETRDFAVGEHQVGRLTGKATVNFGYPVLNAAGQVEAVVYAALDLDWLNEYAADAQLPPQAALTVIDRNGTILVRYPDSARWVGQSAQDAPLAATILAEEGEGTARAPGLDGVDRVYAFTRLGGTSATGAIYVSIGMPTDTAFADARRTLARNLTGLGLVALLTLAAAFIGTRLFILRPVDALVKATRRLSAGDLSTRTGLPHGGGEIGHLARSFDEMAAALERAEERRAFEEELRRKNFELEQQSLAVEEADRLKSEFVSMVSHEMRTPLTSIHGYVYLLLEGASGELAQEQREFLTIVHSSAERLLALINDLLDLSRIEAGRIELDRAKVDLARLVRDVADALRPAITAKQQQLSLELGDGLPAVWADSGRVAQILTNLVSNAHKYTPAGGRIWLAARAEDGRVAVDVRDTGIGLSPEEQAQLFARFFRARNTTTHQVSGTGLGLTITRSLVEMHGGEIRVTSTPGQGSTFSFTLPTASESEPGPASAADELPAALAEGPGPG